MSISMSHMQHGDPAKETFAGAVRDVFLRWERWRLVYNLALVGLVITLAVAWGDGNSNWVRLAVECVLGAIVANLCYFAGPIADAYLLWLGIHHRAVAPFLLGCGLLFTMGLAAVTVGESLSPF